MKVSIKVSIKVIDESIDKSHQEIVSRKVYGKGIEKRYR